MGKPPCRDVSTPPLRPLPSLSSLPPLCSLPAPTHTLRQRYRRGQLLAVGANAMGLAQSVGLLLSTDRLVERALGSGDRSSRLDRAPHVANLRIEMVSSGGSARTDQKRLHARSDVRA